LERVLEETDMWKEEEEEEEERERTDEV